MPPPDSELPPASHRPNLPPKPVQFPFLQGEQLQLLSVRRGKGFYQPVSRQIHALQLRREHGEDVRNHADAVEPGRDRLQIVVGLLGASEGG